MNPITDDVVCSLMEGLEQREKNDLAKQGRRSKKKPGAASRLLRLSKIGGTTTRGINLAKTAHP